MLTEEEMRVLSGKLSPKELEKVIQPPLAEVFIDPVEFVKALTGYLSQLKDFYIAAVDAQSQYIDNSQDPDVLDPIIESVGLLTQVISRLVVDHGDNK